MKLLILSGQRRGEIVALRSSWIKSDTITLPAEITKNRREHTFPIGALGAHALASVAIDQSLPPNKRLLFPARETKSERTFNGWSKSKVALDKISGVSEWTLHDIRRTVASNVAALGVQLPVIERLLNHVSGSFGGIVSVYQKHSFMPEMRAAIEKLETHLSSLLKSEYIAAQPWDRSVPPILEDRSMKGYYTVAEVCALFNVSRATIDRWECPSSRRKIERMTAASLHSALTGRSHCDKPMTSSGRRRLTPLNSRHTRATTIAMTLASGNTGITHPALPRGRATMSPWNSAPRQIGDVLKDRNIILKGADVATAQGFTQVPNFLSKSKKLSSGDKMTFAMLLSYAWQNDFCFPGQKRLGEDIGLHETNVRRHLKSLQANGLLSIIRRGQGKTNIYELNLKPRKL